VTLRSEILSALRNLEPFEEVKTKYRSKSGIYEAIRIVINELEKRLGEARLAINDSEKTLERLRTEWEEQDLQRRKVAKKVAKLELQKNELVKQVAAKKAELDCLGEKVAKLISNGFRPDIVREIEALEKQSGPDLLKSVREFVRCKSLEKENRALEANRTELQEEISFLGDEKRSLVSEVESERNRLDELMLETSAFCSAVNVAKSFLRDGYSSKELEGLKSAVDLYGIRGNPEVSLDRLLVGVRSQKNLFELEERVKQKEDEVKLLSKVAKETQTQVEIAKRTLIDTVHEVAGAIGTLKFDRERSFYSALLASLLGSVEDLRAVPLPVVAQLQERIWFWIRLNLPNASTQPSQSACVKDPKLRIFIPFSVDALAEVVTEFLQDAMISSQAG
jgi:hypothetical protein